MKPQSRKFAGALILAIAVIALFLIFVYTPSKEDTTTTAITLLGFKTRQFYELTNRLPVSLDELKPDANLTKDGWGQPITYEVTGSNTFRLISLGSQGDPSEKEIIYSFDVSDPAALGGVRLQ